MSAEAVLENEEITEFLASIGKKLKTIKNGEAKYAALLSSIVYRDVNDHFEKESGPDGKWTHWSFLYTVQMEKRGKGGNKILQDSGRLRNNFKPTNFKSSNEGPIWFNDATTKGGFPYAYAHNEGDGNLPQRQFMWFSGNAVEKMAEQTLQFMIDEDI